MKLFKPITACLTLYLISINCFTQTDSSMQVFVNTSYVMGGQMTHKTIVFRSGFNGEAGMIKNLSDMFCVGAGIGVIFLENEFFLPTYAKISLNRKNVMPTMKYYFKIGYGFSGNYKINPFENYKYSGGLYMEPGLTYNIRINENISANAGFKAISQFGLLKYKSENIGQEFTEKLRFLLIGFSFGMQF